MGQFFGIRGPAGDSRHREIASGTARAPRRGSPADPSWGEGRGGPPLHGPSTLSEFSERTERGTPSVVDLASEGECTLSRMAGKNTAPARGRGRGPGKSHPSDGDRPHGW